MSGRRQIRVQAGVVNAVVVALEGVVAHGGARKPSNHDMGVRSTA